MIWMTAGIVMTVGVELYILAIGTIFFKNDNEERRINHGTVLRKITRLIARIGSDFVDRDHTYVRVFNDAPYQDFKITERYGIYRGRYFNRSVLF